MAFPDEGSGMKRDSEVLLMRREAQLGDALQALEQAEKHRRRFTVGRPPLSYTRGSELLKRLQADECELCGSIVRVEVHHLPKMADLNRHRRKPVPTWFRLMATRKRKTLIACRACHEAIHTGRPAKQACST